MVSELVNSNDGELRSLLSVCTDCGDCLEACPTYVISGLETESPRGRINLLRFAQDNPGQDNETVTAHIDSCTGCMGCVTACPEEVQYDTLLPLAQALSRLPAGPQARAQAAARKLTLDTITHPWTLRRMTPLIRAARRFPARRGAQQLRAIAELFPDPPPKLPEAPHFTPARGEARGRVGLLLGCSQRIMHPRLQAATIAVLSAEGFEVIAPERPDCCGAIHFSAGDQSGAAERAEKTIRSFQAVGGVDQILTSAGGCGAAMKRYGERLNDADAFAFSSLVSDVCEFLLAHPPRTPRVPLQLTVAWHESCQVANAQRLPDAPGRQLLAAIPELTLLETTEPGLCCGAVGAYRIDQPQLAQRLADRRIRQLLELEPDVIASSSPDCSEQLSGQLQRRGREIPVQHPIELLARSLQLPV